MERTNRQSNENKNPENISLEAISLEYNIQISDLEEMINYYLCEIPYKKMVERFNISRKILFQILKKAGAIDKRNSKRKSTYDCIHRITDDALVEEIINSYTSGKTITQISKAITTKTAYVEEVLMSNGIDIKHKRVIADKAIYEAVVKAYKSGMSIEKISNQFDISKIIITETVKNAGIFVEPPKKKLSEDVINAIIEAHKKWTPVKQIRKQFRVGIDRINEVLDNAGIERRNGRFKAVIDESLIEAVRKARERKVKAIVIQNELGISHGTYYNILKKLGMQKKQLKDAIFSDEKLIKSIIRYYEAGHNLYEVTDEFDISEGLVREILKKYNIPIKRGAISDKKKKDYDIKAIIQDYKKGVKWNEMSEKFGLSVSWMQELLKRNGIEIERKNRIPREDKEKTKQIIELYESGMSLAKLAKMYSTTQTTLKKFLQNSGVKIRNAREAKAALSTKNYNDRVDKIVNAYKEGRPIKEIESEFHTHQRTIYKFLEERNIPRRPRKINSDVI